MAFQIMPTIQKYVASWRGKRRQLAQETGVSYETLARIDQGGKTSMTTKHAQAILDHQDKNRGSA